MDLRGVKLVDEADRRRVLVSKGYAVSIEQLNGYLTGRGLALSEEVSATVMEPGFGLCNGWWVEPTPT